MLVLAIDIDQILSRFAQLARCRGTAVDERARTPAAIDDPAHQTATVTRKLVLGEPLTEPFHTADIEFGADVGALGLLPYNRGVGARSQQVCDVVLKPEFPRNAAGKTLKRVMRDEYWANRTAQI